MICGCGKKEDAAPPAKTNANSSGNPITAPVEYLGAVAQAKKYSEKAIDTAALNQQIQLFNAQEGHFPKDLDELVKEKYLKEIPKPPYGMKFVYDANAGQLKVVKAP